MAIERIYEKYTSETPTTVTIEVGNLYRKLLRCRMYNSQIDVKGFLYTDYHDREYQQLHSAGEPGSRGVRNPDSHGDRVAAAKKGWEARRQRQFS